MNVYRALKDGILTGRLAPGEVISEVEASRRWSVSRTPVREAIRQLEQEGLVLWSPRRGATVAGISVAGVRDVYETREVLEELSARLVAERGAAEDQERLARLAEGVERAHRAGRYLEGMRLDNDFHRTMARATGNRVLASYSERLLDRTLIARMLARRDPGRVDEISDEHLAILAALQARDGPLAAERAGDHVRRARARLMDMLQSSSVDREPER